MEVRPQYLLCIHCNPYKYLSDLSDLNEHLKIHRNLSTLNCGQCRKDIKHRGSLIRHIENQHIRGNGHAENEQYAASCTNDAGNNNIQINEEPLAHRECLICVHCTPHAQLSNIADFRKHFVNHHNGLPSLSCGQCGRQFIHKTSLIRHIENHINNPNQYRESDAGSGDEHLSRDDGTGDHDSSDDGLNQQDTENQGHPNDQPRQNLDLQEEFAKFLLKLRASGNMTNTSIQLIIDNLSLLLKNVMLKAGEDTEAFLNSTEVPPEEAQNFLKSATFNSNNIFNGLETIEQQLKYYSEKLGLVIPEELFLSSRIENRFDRAQRMFLPKQVSETFQYVSLIETLTLIVRNAYFRNLILSETQSEDGVYRSYKDGSDFANNSFLRKYPFALRIVLYYDGLEITNVLGSKDVIHSLGCFYISIQNLPAEESSLLSSIFLLALCYAIDLKAPGAYGKVLAKFVAELKKLQSDEGVEIDLPNGEKFILRAILVTLTADTLAAHEILGFFTSSGANKFCRICLVSKRDIKEDTTAMGIRRTSVLHEQHVREVERRPAAASLYGLRERSPLCEVMRVPEDSVFDVFHDLVGVIQMIIKLTLYEFIIVRKLFTVESFNTNINMFVYGKPDDKNKPSPNFTRERLTSDGHTLKQYGSQTFCLLRIFPFLISGVEESDKYLKLIFLLQDIVKIIFSFEVRESDVRRLEALLYQLGKQFHEIFIAADVDQEGNNEDDDDDDEEEEEEDEHENEDENPDEPMPNPRRVWKSRKLKKGINKLHHLMHYPQQIREKGPIIRLWCARFEGRHRIIRKHSAVQCNFKNAPKTMARMFQLSTLSAFLARNSSHADDIYLSGSVSVRVQNSLYRALLTNEGYQENDVVKVVESAQVCGEEFRSGLFVMLKQDETIEPVFAVIVDVVADNSSQVFLVANKCTNTTLSARYNAYKIQNQFEETNILVNVKNLANHRPIAPWVPINGYNGTELFLYPRTVSV